MKFVPPTVSVNPAPPAVTELGVSDVVAGDGFDCGGGWTEFPPLAQADAVSAKESSARKKTSSTRFIRGALCLRELVSAL